MPQPILADTFDLQTRDGRDQMRKYVVEYDPDLIVIDMPRIPVPMGGPPMKQRAVAERRKTTVTLLSVGDELLQWQTSRGAAGIMLGPKDSWTWKMPPMQASCNSPIRKVTDDGLTRVVGTP